MSKIKNILAAAAIFLAGTTASQAATLGFQAVDGGEMASESVTVIGDPNGFTAFGLEWTMSVTASPATGVATKQEFVFSPVPGLSTTLALSMVDQMFDSGVYTGVYAVVTDVSGLWGDFALVQVSAPSLDGFSSGNLKVIEATPIPLPAGAVLLLSGLVGFAAVRRAKS